MAPDNPAVPSTVSAVGMQVPLTADRVAPPRLVYGGLDPLSPDGRDQAYAAIYFEVEERDVLGRVTFEGLDAIRGSRGEVLPYETAGQFTPGDWVLVVDRSPWLEERHRYEVSHYETPLLDTHRHYLFWFHDEFIEAIAEGIWFDHADPSDPFAPPRTHPLKPFGLDLPGERFVSASGIEWELRRSPRADSDLIRDSRYCSQRVFQFNLLLDGDNRESASIWIRTTNGVLESRISRSWAGEMGRLTGFAQPGDFSEQWETYVEQVARNRREMGK